MKIMHYHMELDVTYPKGKQALDGTSLMHYHTQLDVTYPKGKQVLDGTSLK
jgi:hypothetical protein